jgi:type IV pilus assembly protein PilF
MMQKKLRRLYWLCFMIGMTACGQNVQDNNYTPSNKDAEIHLKLGVEYMRIGKNGIALNKLQTALRLDSNYADAHNAIAVLYGRLKLNDKSRQHYQKALALKPNGSDIHNNYGQFLCKQKQWKEAEKHFLKALDNPVYEKPEIPLTNAGLCSKDSIKAEDYLRQALQKNPKFPRALFKMADLSFEQRRYKQAQKYLQRYMEIANDTSQTLWLGTRIEDALNNRTTAANYMLLLRKNFPDASETQLLNQLKRR